MPLLDAIKNAFGSKARADKAPDKWCSDLLAQFETSSLETLLRTLRIKWLGGAFEEEANRTLLESKVLPRLKDKYPDNTDNFDLMLGAFTLQKEEYYTEALRQRAVLLRQQQRWPVEANLFLARYHFQHLLVTQGHWFLYHELNGAAGPFMAVEFYRRYRLFGAFLYDRAGAEGEDSLTRFDALAAAQLAYEHFQRAGEIARRFADRLEPVVGQSVAQSVDAACNKGITQDIKDAEKLVRLKAAQAGPDFAAVASCTPVVISRQHVIESVKQAVLAVRCKDSDPLFSSINLGAETGRLAGFSEHIAQIQTDYDGYLPLLELDAELAEQRGNHREAAEQFAALCRKKPQSAYYAYRTGKALRAAGDPQASRYLIHASRRAGTRWRDEIASGRAALMAYEYEGAALREVFPERRAECASTLADRLEEHWQKAGPPRWDLETAACLALRIAQLRHFVLEQTPSEDRSALDVVNAYHRVDCDGEAQLRQRVPEAVFDPIQPMRIAS